MCVPFCLPNNIALEFILAARATFSTIVSPRNPKQYWVFYGAPTIKMLPKKSESQKQVGERKVESGIPALASFIFFFLNQKFWNLASFWDCHLFICVFFFFFFFLIYFHRFRCSFALCQRTATAGIKCRSSGAAIFQWVYAFFYRKNCAIRSVWIEKKKHLTKHVSPYLFICLSMRLMSRAKRSQKHPIPMSPALA